MNALPKLSDSLCKPDDLNIYIAEIQIATKKWVASRNCGEPPRPVGSLQPVGRKKAGPLVIYPHKNELFDKLNVFEMAFPIRTSG